MPSVPSLPPSDTGVTASVAPPERPPGGPDGGMIGRYRLLESLGEGGWGAVYLAEQTEPVRRRVALKVIKLGMDTRSVLARFEGERQALALMDHPNIARVLDGGATASGRPYFAMELVRGLRITDYCARHRLGARERLVLFRQVCAAVQHAHQKGIIHRDLKPSNILVSGEGPEAAVKVIDFGIAKSMHGRLTDATVHTGVEQAIGTPAYMSPEQLESDGLDLDTRSDIYALGVVLHELLAGRPPFDPAELDRAGPEGLRRLILEREPPSLAKVAVTGVVDASELRGELEWITRKALEKSRERRYESAAALSDDLARHLGNEPVLARSPGRTYLVRKFVSRHRVGVGAAAAVLVSLVAGITLSVWQARAAFRAERQAREAQRRSDELLDFMTGGLRDSLARVGRLDVLEAVGEKARRYFDSIDATLLDDSIRLQHAKIVRQLGEVRLRMGKHAEAVRVLEESLARAESVIGRNPDSRDALFERGQSEFSLGEAWRSQRDQARAFSYLQRYRDTGLRLVALEPANPRWQLEVISGLHNLAVLKRDSGDLEGAKRDMQEKRLKALALLPKLPAAEQAELERKIHDASSWIGSIEEQSGNFSAALLHFEEEARGLERLVAAYPGNLDLQYKRADNCSFRSGLFAITGRAQLAREAAEAGLEIIGPLVAHDSSNIRWRHTQLRLHLRLAEAMIGGGNPREAAVALDFLLLQLRAPSQEPRADVVSRLMLCSALRLSAWCVSDSAAQQKLVEESVDILNEVRAAGGGLSAAAELVHGLLALYEFANLRGDSGAAEALIKQALETIEPHAGSRYWLVLDPLARAKQAAGDKSGARAIRERLDKAGYRPIRSMGGD